MFSMGNKFKNEYLLVAVEWLVHSSAQLHTWDLKQGVLVTLNIALNNLRMRVMMKKNSKSITSKS